MIVMIVASACQVDEERVPGFRQPESFPYETLAEYDFFEEPLAGFTPVSGVVPYQVTSPLWADHRQSSVLSLARRDTCCT